MIDQITDGMLRQLELIELALNRKLTAEDEPKELRDGLFYINPDEIVQIDGDTAYRVPFFKLSTEIQDDIFLNYGMEGV